MKSLSSKRLWSVVLATSLVALTISSNAQDSSRDRGTAIIFSAPKSDTISTNLETINQKESPFKGMESNIRKPFEIFDTDATRPRFVHPRNMPTPARDNNTVKSILEKKAEEQFLNGENSSADDPNDPFKSPDSTLDPYGNRKPKTALDRYYDRLEKDHSARTNSNSSTDLFGRKKDEKSDDYLNPDSKEKSDSLNREQDSYTRMNRRMSNNASTDKENSSLSGFTKATKLFDAKPSSAADREFLQRESRLENFKKLLDGDNGAPSQNNYLNPSVSAYGNPSSSATRPNYLTPTTPSYQPKPYGNSQPNYGSSFNTTAGVIGAPGRPAGVQDFGVSAGASLSTPIAPPQQPRRVISTYNPPTRR